MVLPGELRTPEDGDSQPADNPYRSGFPGKVDIAALLEEHLQLLPEGLDPEVDPTILEQLIESARPKSEPDLSAHLRPCRDPTKDRLLAALHAVEAFHPAAFAAATDALLLISGLLLLGCLALNAAAVWTLWAYGESSLAIAGMVFLLLHLPVTSALLAADLGGHHRVSAWFAVPLYDMSYLTALPLLQRRSLSQRRRLACRLTQLPEAEMWLWQYRACRQLVFSALFSVPMAALGVAGCVRAWRLKAEGSEAGVAAAAPPVAALGVLAAATVVSVLQAATGLGEAALNARWAGQMTFVSYCLLALRLRGSKKLPYDWQSQLAEQRLLVRPDAPDFASDLSRPQQCQLLRLALQRPYFAISNVATHPRPLPRTPPPQPSGCVKSAAAAAAGAGVDGGLREGRSDAVGTAAAWWRRCVAAATHGSCRWVRGCGRQCGGWTGADGCSGRRRSRHRRRGSDSSDCDAEDAASSRRPRVPPSACLLLQSKSAVKAVVGLLAGPLAAARATLEVSDFSVNLVSFSDAASCRHCRKLLELVIRQGLRSLMLCDAKLQLDFFGVLTSYLPSRSCVLTRLVLKDVMSSGISTLCMLCEGMSRNASVVHLDLSNNQLWGVRGAKELRLMLRGSGALRVLLLPFCNITSLGAAEILRGALECPTLEQIDFSQNHIGDDVPDWSEVEALRNTSMREVDLSFNWIQDSLMGWTAALLEAFPTLQRLHLNHNSDAAASRAASRAATPKMMTPRTLTPRTLTPSNLRVASYSNAAASLAAAAAAAAAATHGGAAAAGGPTSSSLRERESRVALASSAAAAAPPLLQPMPSTLPAAAALSPCGSERLERLASSSMALAGPGISSGLGGPLSGPCRQAAAPNAAANPNPNNGNVHNSSVNATCDWQQPQPQQPGRSRGHHLIAHLELYVLQQRTAAATAAATGGGGAATVAAFVGDVVRRSLGRDSSLPATAVAYPGCEAGGSAASAPVLSAQASLACGSNMDGCSAATAAAAGAHCGRSPGSLWSAVAAMERVDLRGVPLPSWWARNTALRPQSVLIDEAQVYDEAPPAPAPAAVAGSGGSGGGGLELPHHVVRSLEAGLASGLVVIDLNSPEYKFINRAQQLTAIYAALQFATHITISNAPRGCPAGPLPPGLQSIASASLQQQLSPGGGGANGGGGGVALVRSATASFARTNSGTAALVMHGGQLSGGVRLMSENGYVAVGADSVSPRRTPTLLCAALATARSTVGASAGCGPVSTGGGGGAARLGCNSSLHSGGGTAAGLASTSLGSLASGDLGSGGAGGGGGGRASVSRRGGEGSVSSLHRFALERGGSSFTGTGVGGAGGGGPSTATAGPSSEMSRAAGGPGPARIQQLHLTARASLTRCPTAGSTHLQHQHHHLLDQRHRSFHKQLSLRHSTTAASTALQYQVVLPQGPQRSSATAALATMDHAALAVSLPAVLCEGAPPVAAVAATAGAVLMGSGGDGVGLSPAAAAADKTDVALAADKTDVASARIATKPLSLQSFLLPPLQQQPLVGATGVCAEHSGGGEVVDVLGVAAAATEAAPQVAEGHVSGSLAGRPPLPPSLGLPVAASASVAVAGSVPVPHGTRLGAVGWPSSSMAGPPVTSAPAALEDLRPAAKLREDVQRLLEYDSVAPGGVDGDGRATPAPYEVPFGSGTNDGGLHGCDASNGLSAHLSSGGAFLSAALPSRCLTASARPALVTAPVTDAAVTRTVVAPSSGGLPGPIGVQQSRVRNAAVASLVARGCPGAAGQSSNKLAGHGTKGRSGRSSAPDGQSTLSSVGSGRSSLLLEEGMASEMIDAGIAILRGGHGAASVSVAAEAPTGVRGSGGCLTPPPGSPASATPAAAASPVAGTRKPLSKIPLTVSQPAEPPVTSFSFMPCSRVSLDEPGQQAASAHLPVTNLPLPAPLESSPRPRAAAPQVVTAGEGVGLDPCSCGAMAALEALWDRSTPTGGDGGGACAEDEDLEVSFRVDATARAALRSMKAASVKVSGCAVGTDVGSAWVAAAAPGGAQLEMASEAPILTSPVAGDEGCGGHGGCGMDASDSVRFWSGDGVVSSGILPRPAPAVLTPLSQQEVEPRISVALLAATAAASDVPGADAADISVYDTGMHSAPIAEAGGGANVPAVSLRKLRAPPVAAVQCTSPCNTGRQGQQHSPSRHQSQGHTHIGFDASLNYGGNARSTSPYPLGASSSMADRAARGTGGDGGISVARVISRARSTFTACQTTDTVDGTTDPDAASTTGPITTEAAMTDTGSGTGGGRATVAAAAATGRMSHFHPQLLSPVSAATAAVNGGAGGVASATASCAGVLRATLNVGAPVGGYGGGGGGGGCVGVEASNAVAVVIVVGADGSLRVPLRCLELPLRGAMCRRPGTTVSFRASGLSHEGMRQLRALMAVARVPMPERSYAWLLPSQSMHMYTGSGYAPASGACGGSSQPLHSASAAFGAGSGYSGLGLALYGGGGPGSTGGGAAASRAVSRLDSGMMYGGLPSYYFDNRGQPVDLGYILPPQTDSAEPSGCLSGLTSAAATGVWTQTQMLPQTAATGTAVVTMPPSAQPAYTAATGPSSTDEMLPEVTASATQATQKPSGCEMVLPPVLPPSPPASSSWTVSVTGVMALPPSSAPPALRPPLLMPPAGVARIPAPADPATLAAAALTAGFGADAEAAIGNSLMASPFHIAALRRRSTAEDFCGLLPTPEARSVKPDGDTLSGPHCHLQSRGQQPSRRSLGGPPTLPHGVMLVNLPLRCQATPPTPVIIGFGGGGEGNSTTIVPAGGVGSTTIVPAGDAGFNVQHSGSIGARVGQSGERGSGGGNESFEHPLYTGTLECAGEPHVSLVGPRVGVFSGCGGLASGSFSAYGRQSLGSMVADLTAAVVPASGGHGAGGAALGSALGSACSAAATCGVPSSLAASASSAGLCERLGSRGFPAAAVTVAGFGSTIDVGGSSGPHALGAVVPAAPPESMDGGEAATHGLPHAEGLQGTLSRHQLQQRSPHSPSVPSAPVFWPPGMHPHSKQQPLLSSLPASIYRRGQGTYGLAAGSGAVMPEEFDGVGFGGHLHCGEMQEDPGPGPGLAAQGARMEAIPESRTFPRLQSAAWKGPGELGGRHESSP